MYRKTLEERLLYPQRAVRFIEITPGRVIFALVAWVAADGLLCLLTRAIFGLWRSTLAFALRFTGIPGRVIMERVDLTGPLSGISLRVPLLEMLPHSPDFLHWGWIAWMTVVAWWGVSFLPERFMPVQYLTRFLCAVQASSLCYFALWPASFAYGVTHFSRTQAYAAYAFLLLIPPLLSLCYFLLAFSSLKKIALLAVCISFVALAVPLQIMLCAIVTVHLSLIVLPVFYLAIGPLLFVAWFVAFFGWGMSWRTEGAA